MSDDTVNGLRAMGRLIGDNAHAAGFHDLGQYRAALLGELVKLLEGPAMTCPAASACGRMRRAGCATAAAPLRPRPASCAPPAVQLRPGQAARCATTAARRRLWRASDACKRDW